ncbi:MAG: hypothetical protein H6819_00065 [Phycisphaerales bacterium]|nr:hypothetical protein [Phycisphaerales bacterium]MCB9857399.1 hypothetical protein [Phycisphaerales bacterium]MCB9864986.1 hypothetical protein [Phycisphaerales bacterium]
MMSQSKIQVWQSAAASTGIVRGRIVLLCLAFGWIGLSGGVDARGGELDCDNNGVPDAEELSGNDCNANGVLDVCENDTLVPVSEISGIRVVPSVGYEHGNIDIDGDTAVVGEPGNFVSGVGYLGRVLCYQYSPGIGWELTQTIYEEEGGNPRAFGDRVIVRGDRLIITAPTENVSSAIGAVYCYRRIGGEWQFQQRLGTIQPRGRFGVYAALEANRLYVGEVATSTSISATRPRAYCFVDRGDGFELEQTIHMGSWVDNLGHLVDNMLFSVRGNIMVKVEVQPIETIVGFPHTGQASIVYCAVIYEWEAGRWLPRQRVPIASQAPPLAVPRGFTDCFIEENRIILTPYYAMGDGLGFNSVVILEKDAGGWHVVPTGALSFGVAPSWVEKSDEGYYIGASELVFTESGPVVTGRPDLGFVVDRSHRSGNWWGAEVSSTALPYPTANISRIVADCDGDGTLDECEIANGAPDVDGDLVPDSCQEDCNGDGIPDESQMALGDCNANGILDVCDVNALDPDGNGITSSDCNANGIPDECEADCDENGIPDECDLDATDPDGDGLVASDCDGNGRPDACDIRGGLVRTGEIRPSDSISGQAFGVSISLDGDVLAVGAPSGGVQGPDGDRVYVYRRSGEVWSEEAVILPDGLSESLYSFGYSVAVSGDILVVKGEGEPSENVYYVYTYHYDGANWQWEATTTVSPQTLARRSDIVLDGNRMALSSDHSRKVIIYEYDNGNWNVAHTVSLAESGGFAERIALDDDLLIAGYGANDGQIFRFDGQNWQLIARSRNIGRTLTSSAFAARPMISGDLVAFGNRTGFGPTANSDFSCGSAQLYRLVGDQLLIEDLFYGLQVGEALSVNQFGRSTAFVGNRLIVGAPAVESSSGRIQLFERDGGNWVLRQTIPSPVAPLPQDFGSEMAASGDTLAVVASGLGIPAHATDDDVIYIYETDRDVDDDGVLDVCQPDCDGNELPDAWELANATIDVFAAALVSAEPSCAFDANNDDAINGLDIATYIEQLLAGP